MPTRKSDYVQGRMRGASRWLLLSGDTFDSKGNHATKFTFSEAAKQVTEFTQSFPDMEFRIKPDTSKCKTLAEKLEAMK